MTRRRSFDGDTSAAGAYAASRRWTLERRDARWIYQILRGTHDHAMHIDELRSDLKAQSRRASESGYWTETRVRRAIRESRQSYDNGKSTWFLSRARGGRTVLLTVSGGRHPKLAGHAALVVSALGVNKLPSAASRALNTRAARASAFGTNAKVHHGKWSSPDLVVFLYSRQGSRKPFEAHSFELQEPKKNPRSVSVPTEIAQSWVSSAGFTRCWFMLHVGTWRALDDRERQRSIRIARRLGVGLITYRTPSQTGTWRLIHKAHKLEYAAPPSKTLRDYDPEARG